jgi:hypothetical protein|eukprot:COSAG01_NODE_8710_length_2681_cov_4.165251_3_plen_130_part_00
MNDLCYLKSVMRERFRLVKGYGCLNWQQRATRALLSTTCNEVQRGGHALHNQASLHDMCEAGRGVMGCAVRQLVICASGLAPYRLVVWRECQSVGDESVRAKGGWGFPPRSGRPGGRTTSPIMGARAPG